MPCNCSGSKANGTKVTYVVQSPDGTRKTYATEIEARVAALKVGGSYQPSVGR